MRHYFSLFLTSASIFIYELLIVRVFSILFKYNVVFLMISAAVMGLGLGGFFFYRFLKQEESLPAWVWLGFPLSVSLSLWLVCRWFAYIKLQGAVFGALVPFFLGGCILSFFYATRPEKSGRLYFFDLTGGVAGCLLSLVLVQWLGVINAILFCAVTAAGAVYFSSAGQRVLRHLGLALTLILLLVNVTYGFLRIGPEELKKTDTPIGWISRHMENRFQWLGSSWNLFSRCDLFSEEEQKKDQRRPIFINGGTEAMMIPGKSYEQTYKRFRHDITFLPLLFGANDKTLILGSGGGRDVRLALMAGARQVIACEIDRGVIDMVEANREYTGDIYAQPGVTLKVEDGRTFIMRDRHVYDRLVLSLSSTFGYSDISGIGQMENYLYTREAFKEYFQHLKPEGMITVFINYRELLSKFILTSLVYMRDNMGISPRQGMTRIAVISDSDNQYNGYGYALMIKKNPFDFATLEQIEREAQEAGLELLVLPFATAYGDFRKIARGSLTPEALMQNSRVNLAVPTDDQPFFLEVILQYRYSLMYLAAVMISVLLLFILLYLSVGKRPDPAGQTPHYLALFTLLGVAFMLVEIALTKRFSFYLAYPQLNLAVVLVSLLAGCGLGSLTSGLFHERLPLKISFISLLLVLVILASSYLITPFLQSTVRYSLSVRCLFLAAVLFPTSFLLGMPFPLALRSLSEKSEVSWFWAVNGISSVIGAVVSVILAMAWGFQAVFYAAAGCYTFAALIGSEINRAIKYRVS
ncbi:MAG: hypothetical protein ACE5GM_05090 [bacterium]